MRLLVSDCRFTLFNLIAGLGGLHILWVGVRVPLGEAGADQVPDPIYDASHGRGHPLGQLLLELRALLRVVLVVHLLHEHVLQGAHRPLLEAGGGRGTLEAVEHREPRGFHRQRLRVRERVRGDEGGGVRTPHTAHVRDYRERKYYRSPGHDDHCTTRVRSLRSGRSPDRLYIALTCAHGGGRDVARRTRVCSSYTPSLSLSTVYPQLKL